DEQRIAALVGAGAPIDAFGVGTRLSTSFDEPALGGVYKLVELQRDGTVSGRVKTSTDKATLPGRKQVWRRVDANGTYAGDIVTAADEHGPADAEPLLTCVMRRGRRRDEAPALPEIRDRALAMVARLPAGVQALDGGSAYPVEVSERLALEHQRL